jgi:polar amino acid transport system substrate-binding protein
MLARSVRRAIAVSVALAALAGVVAGCGSSDSGSSTGSGTSQTDSDVLATIKDRGVLTVGAYSYPPYSELVSDEWEGFYSEFTDAIAKKMGVDVNVVFLNPAAFIPAIESGRVDTVIGLSKTPERAAAVDFSDPMMWIPPCVIARGDDDSINSVADLDGKVLGLTRSSVGETRAKDFIKEGVFKPKAVRTYDTYEAPLLEIVNGRVDAGVWDVVGAQDAAKKANYDIKCIVFSDKGDKAVDGSAAVSWVFRKGGEADTLKAEMNRIQGELQKDGTFARILEKYGLTDPSLLSGEVSEPAS